MKRFWLILAACLGLAVSALPASAAIQSSLKCSTTACGGSTTYGTVTLTQSGSGSSAKVTVSVSLNSGYTFSGDNKVSSLVFNGATNDTLSMTNFSSGFGATSSGANGSLSASPFTNDFIICISDCFDYGVQRSNGAGTPTSLSFDVTKSGGLTLSNFTDNDGGGFYFAAQIRTTNNDNMFWVASNKIPEPGTMGLSLTVVAGLAGLVMLQRRRKLARAA
jgi:hypothetical protein